MAITSSDVAYADALVKNATTRLRPARMVRISCDIGGNRRACQSKGATLRRRIEISSVTFVIFYLILEAAFQTEGNEGNKGWAVRYDSAAIGDRSLHDSRSRL